MSQHNNREQLERRVCSVICRGNGLKAREIAGLLDMDRSTVNHILYSSPLLKELCYQDDGYRWREVIKQARLHVGLYEFSG